jgi:tripartite-type tricarboxylate transporter receptor subunit TctC
VIVAAALCAATAALAQGLADAKKRVESLRPADFPKRAIELMVPTPAGGGLDVTARLLAKSFDKVVDQSMIVNNRVGAGGFVGYTWLATQAPNDGTAIGLVSPTVFGDAFLRAQGKWTLQDIEPIAFLNYEPVAWIVSTDGRFKDKSFKDVIATAKDEAGKVTVAVASQTAFEFLAEQIEDAAGVKFNKVPFQGGAPAVTALLGNHIDVSFGYLGEFRGHLESGKVKVIAVAGAVRSPFLPDAPTVNEALGVSDILRVAFRYIGAPKGIPAGAKAYVSAGLEAALDDPDLAAEYRKVGAIMDRKINSPAATAAEVNKLAALEHAFFVKTGRLKP